MFKNIQKYLLINHPLLWNLKIVPLSCILIVLNLIFFVIGYTNGAINFMETNDNYTYHKGDGFTIFFSILISLLVIILWLINYLKNNALKSFYPKNSFSLYKEWLLILLICFLNSSFILAYYYGKDVRIRSYYSEKEAKERCEILSEASFFINGSYSYNIDYDSDELMDKATDKGARLPNDTAAKPQDFFLYRGIKYHNFSLLNKNINSYSFFGFKEDSLRKIKIKDWLVDNKKEELKLLFKKYLAIAKEHKLKANISENQWFELIYDYPKYEKYKNIGSKEFELVYDNSKNKIDSTEQYYKTINNNLYLCNRYYVPEESLKHSYETIADSWVKSNANFQSLLVTLFVAIGLSLLFFSFRISSGRNWLITFVAMAVLNIFVGIITAICNSKFIYPTTIVILFLLLIIYFFIIIRNNKGKRISGITVNLILWILPIFGPIVYALVLEIAKKVSNYNYIQDIVVREKNYPLISFLKKYDLELLWVNVAFIFLMMLLFTIKIRKWRGIAEN